jgi:hypothetical protein
LFIFLLLQSADMAVKEPSGGGEERVWHDGKDALGDARAPPRMEMERLPRGKAVILKRNAYRAPIFFKDDQAGIV